MAPQFLDINPPESLLEDLESRISKKQFYKALMSAWLALISRHCRSFVESLPQSVSVYVYGCLSLYASSVMNWRPVQGVPCLSANISWDKLQPTASLHRRSGDRLMDRPTEIWRKNGVGNGRREELY